MTIYHPFRSAKAKEQYLNYYDIQAKAWPLASEAKMLDTSYGQTFVRISGPDGAPPLVLLPPAGGTSLFWKPNIEALSVDYKTYAVDNIFDNGRSVYSRPIKKPSDFVDWLDDLFTALDLGDNINLMGLSFGGWQTSLYALRFPQRLDKIVLLAPVATVLPVRLAFWVRAIPCIIPIHPYFPKSMFHWAFADLVNKDEAGRAVAEAFGTEMFLASRCYKLRPVPPVTVLTDEEWQSLNVPTLYLVGENEKIFSAQKAVQRLNKVAPQVKTKIILNAGHDLTVVQAEMVNRKVLDFLERQVVKE